MKTLPIIRHVRYWLTKRRVDRHYALRGDVGYHVIYRASDDEHLVRIWEGDE